MDNIELLLHELLDEVRMLRRELRDSSTAPLPQSSATYDYGVFGMPIEVLPPPTRFSP